MTNHVFNGNACLYLTAKRLRYMRRSAESLPVAVAYEQALRILLDEHLVGSADWHALFYGPQGEENSWINHGGPL